MQNLPETQNDQKVESREAPSPENAESYTIVIAIVVFVVMSCIFLVLFLLGTRAERRKLQAETNCAQLNDRNNDVGMVQSVQSVLATKLDELNADQLNELAENMKPDSMDWDSVEDLFDRVSNPTKSRHRAVFEANENLARPRLSGSSSLGHRNVGNNTGLDEPLSDTAQTLEFSASDKTYDSATNLGPENRNKQAQERRPGVNGYRKYSSQLSDGGSEGTNFDPAGRGYVERHELGTVSTRARRSRHQAIIKAVTSGAKVK